MTATRVIFLTLGIILSGFVQAATLLDVPQNIWDALTNEQQATLGQAYTVNVLATSGYGTILDVQAINQSTAGTTAGSELGARYGSAAYVDRAFSGRNINYSATSHVSAQLIGALIGSAADRPGIARFHMGIPAQRDHPFRLIVTGDSGAS